ncbi:MAG: hypothetical protein ACOX5A_08975 [Aminivibrio sp.]
MRIQRKAMALPLTLIVLLVAGALVGVSLYLIENMKTTTEMKIHDEARLNAALAGVERGKQWIYEKVKDGESPSHMAAGPISSLTSAEQFKELLVRDGNDAPNPTLQFEMGELKVEVRIYDLAYDPTSALEFEKGMPPRMYVTTDISNIKASSSNASSNDGEGNLGAGAQEKKIWNVYLIRATATDSESGISKYVEQAVSIKP